MVTDPFHLFALNSTCAFGQRVADRLGIALAKHEEREFEDGEHKARPLVNIRNSDVYVLQQLHGDNAQSVNDKLCRLLFFLGALKDASAAHVTAVVPYLSYARKDQKSKARDPVTTRYVAAMFESVGVDRVVTMDVHNLAAFQNAFRCRTDHLLARGLFVDRLSELGGEKNLVVVSPDIGGVKRAEQFRQALELKQGRPVATAFLEKYRSKGVVSGSALIGDVKDKLAIIFDDLISTGGTIQRAAHACRQAGADSVFAVATHGLFVGNAAEVLADPAIKQVFITNTVPPFRIAPNLAALKLTVVDAAELFAQAIKRLHSGGSLTDLVGV